MSKKHQQYISFLQELNEDRLEELSAFVAQNVRFKDPIHDVTGINEMVAIFKKMFGYVKDVKFSVNYAMSSSTVCLLEWEFEGKLQGKKLKFNGASRLQFGEDGLVKEHIDYWDAGSNFFAKLPIVGWLITLLSKWVQGRFF